MKNDDTEGRIKTREDNFILILLLAVVLCIVCVCVDLNPIRTRTNGSPLLGVGFGSYLV